MFIIGKSNKFYEHNAKENFQTSSPHHLNCHIGRLKGKSERAERQESLHTTCGPIGYLGSATNLHV